MRITSIILLVSTFLLITSCSNDDATSASSFTDIIGTVELYDDNQNIIDNSGMTVTVEDTSPQITAITDIDGDYLIKNVPFGAHTLIFEKEGFGTHKIFNVEHNNIGSFTLIPNELKLGQISNSEIRSTSIRKDGNFFVLTVNRPTSTSEDFLVKRLRIFYHNSDAVSNTNYTAFSPLIQTNENPALLTFSIAFFKTLGFESGNTLWFRVYADNFYSNDYEDPDLDRTVLPNVNPNTADPISIIIP